MKIGSAGRATAIMLWESIGDSRLPWTEVQLLLRLSGLLDRRLQLPFEVPAGDLSCHWREKSKIPWVCFRCFIPQDVPSPWINAKWGKAERSFAERIEQKLGEIVTPANRGNPERIVRPMVCRDDLANEAGVTGVDVGPDHVNGRCQCAPQADKFLHSSATWVLNARNGNTPLRQLRGRIAEPYV